MRVTEWIPALAVELKGKNSSPNWDFVFHLNAQQIARSLGINWSANLSDSEVETLRNALRAKFA